MAGKIKQAVGEKKSPEVRRVIKTTTRTILLEQARWKLARLWFILTGVILLLLIAQSVLGKYAGKTQEAWGWALPTILPTLSLILASLGATALETDENPASVVNQNFYRTAFWLSAAYLLLVLGTILIEPLTQFEALELLKLSNLWLGPLQGLVASAIGIVFFIKGKAK